VPVGVGANIRAQRFGSRSVANGVIRNFSSMPFETSYIDDQASDELSHGAKA
jgi:hypothetical protein